ncbi:MAG: hypothetical protein QW196_02415 [Sulfolobales archaeon]
MSKEQKEKKYKLVESRELCTVYGVPHDNDDNSDILTMRFIDENGIDLDPVTYFEGTVILGMYEHGDKLYVIAEIPGMISHDIYLWVFERVE